MVGSTADTDARDNIDLQTTATGVPIYWHNGAKLANGYADFWGVSATDGWEGTPKLRDGADSSGNDVATGTQSWSTIPETDRGTAFPGKHLGSATPISGDPTALGREIANVELPTNTIERPYYAISPVFTVGAVPSFDFVAPGGAKQLRMVWTLLEDGGRHISHFELQRSTDGGTTWTDAGDVPPVPDRRTTWYDSGLAAGTEYVYRVRAIADGGYEGAWSAASTTATTLTAADEIPAAPGPPTMSVESGEARVEWTAPTETGGSAIASYDVRRRPAGCDQTFAVIPDDVTGTQYDDADFDGLDAGIYLYSVRAVNTDGEAGAWSLDGELHTDGSVPVLAWKPAFCPEN